ncbi:hypothetical protein HNR39_000683 [Glaciimonas immobilis]|uniref:Uncharacterized protein n=1 Tax=Glaciimonas immobilis TaxID=728004 RepID=A0A840RM88_9BURK|nr:hypothetical protein [Glaciimonas immobilis]
MLNQFTKTVGRALFACSPDGKKGECIGQRLFEQA